MPVNFGNEVKGFVDGLQIASGLYDAMSTRDLREQQGAYYAQRAEQEGAEFAEWNTPEAAQLRRRNLQTAADTASVALRQAQIGADEAAYKFEEYSDPTAAGQRQAKTQYEIDAAQHNLKVAELAYQSENLKFLEASSPAAVARREQAEALASQGKISEAITAAVTTEKELNALQDLRREAGKKAAILWQTQHPNQELPPELEAKANLPYIPFADDFGQRWNIPDMTAVAQGQQPQGALPVAPAAPQSPAPTAPATTGSLGANGLPDVGTMEAYIRQAASARGIDPNTAVAVARTEGLAPGVWQSRLPAPGGGAGREASYGPFQLYTGGGLGNAFQAKYGVHPSDPSSWMQQVDFALDNAKQGGWTPWHGAANNGISRWAGINPNAPGVSSTAPPLAQSSVSTSAPVNPATLPPGFTAPAAPAVPASAPATTGSVSAPAPATAGPPSFQAGVDEMALAGTQARYQPLMGTAVPTQQQSEEMRKLYRGDGMADPGSVKALDEFMSSDWDYDNLTPRTRMLVNELAAFDYAKQSDPEKAKQIAGELQRMHDAEASRYLAFAKAAIQAGDEKGVLDNTMKMAAAIPNGVDATFEKQEDGDYLISFVREGKEIHRELVEPDRLMGTIWNMGPKDIQRMLWIHQGLGGTPASQEGMQSVTMGQPDYSLAAGMTEDESKAFYARADARTSKTGTETADAIKLAADELVGTTDILGIGRGTIGPVVADFPAELQTEITKFRPYLEEVAGRVADTNGISAQAAVSTVFGQLMGINPKDPGNPPYEWEQLDENTIAVNTETGPPIYITADDFAYIMGRREELENQYTVAKETAAQTERRRPKENEELGRRLESGLPVFGAAEEGEGPAQLTYDQFVDLWESQHPPQGTMSIEGEFLEVDQSAQMQRDWEIYQQQSVGR